MGCIRCGVEHFARLGNVASLHQQLLGEGASGEGRVANNPLLKHSSLLRRTSGRSFSSLALRPSHPLNIPLERR